jgi:hypothetical protein
VDPLTVKSAIHAVRKDQRDECLRKKIADAGEEDDIWVADAGEEKDDIGGGSN